MGLSRVNPGKARAVGDPDPEVRLEAVKAVARKDGDIAGIFLQAATGDPSNLVSEAALGLLR